MKAREKAILEEWTAEFKIALTEAQMGLLDLFLSELWEWNKKMNLTGISSRERIVKELLLDSLLPSPFLPEEGRLLDMGSGAGFPAIPLKICRPGLEVRLVEANFKKSVFLKQVVRRAKLDGISVIRGRMEDKAALPIDEESFQIVSSRAMSGLRTTAAMGAPYLAPGGLLVVFAGRRLDRALSDASEVLQGQTLTVSDSIPYRLPGKGDLRNLLLLRKGSQPKPP